MRQSPKLKVKLKRNSLRYRLDPLLRANTIFYHDIARDCSN